MMESRSLRILILIIAAVSAAAAVLSLFQLPYQFFVWEFFLDGRILAITLLTFIAWKRGVITVPGALPALRTFRIRENLTGFLAPLAFYAVTIGAGIGASAVRIDPLDNAATLILATLFDIPAIYVFSITSVLVEEYVFRGILLDAFRQRFHPFTAALLSSLLWTLFMASEIAGLPELTPVSAMVFIPFIIVIGLFCSVLALRYSTIWIGYSFRIGIIALTPIILTSIVTEADAFFVTASPWWSAEGWGMSILMILTGFFLFRRIGENGQKSLN